ncbi:MAG: S8 family peptidase [Rhizomicrobium sp.]|nr:S8 family peptidase [Rhizomicrobium sp.]
MNDYLNGEVSPAGNPPYKAKVESIEAIRMARLETLWTDKVGTLPADPQTQIWWALWCHRGRVGEVLDVCARLNVRVAANDRWLYFPEIIVVPVLTSRTTVELIMFATGGLAELRRASDNPFFYTDQIRGEEQEWVENLSDRIQWPGADAPAVCILDTGVNRGHVLLEPALAPDDLHTLQGAWNTDDHSNEGHGTSMAGLALHGDLTAAIGDTSQRRLFHRLESVKVLPPGAFDPNDPRSYGVLTQSAIVLPEIQAPERSRVYCMAVTNENVSGSTASGWSAAIDQAAVGRMIADTPLAENGEILDDHDRPKRLIILSAGNIPAEIDYTRIQPHDNYPIEDPAQAWNALTVGGYTDLIDVREDDYDDWTPAANAGEISPHTRTSATWPQGTTPIKPELVMEAGNRAISPSRREIVTLGSLSLLSTGKDAETPLVSFDATSAAAAQAARMAAQLQALHPDYWPETIRAMLIHSAEWTGPMIASLLEAAGKRARYELVRRFGYGVPDFRRANASATNHLALFTQTEIQPFKMDAGRKFNTCHYYKLPIPAALLEELENEQLEMKVTLSYFIDPNPGLAANVDPQRYQSHGFRFDHQRKNETATRFKLRVNPAERDDPSRRPPIESVDPRWLLGEDSVSAGSVHCDTWRGPAIELLNRELICVKPVNGWWRNRASRDVCTRKSRYALIVSIKAINTGIDLYTPIVTSIGLPIPIPVEIEI